MDVTTAQTIFYLTSSVVLTTVAVLFIAILIVFIRTARRLEHWMDNLETRVQDAYKTKLKIQVKVLEFLGYLLGLGNHKGGD